MVTVPATPYGSLLALAATEVIFGFVWALSYLLIGYMYRQRRIELFDQKLRVVKPLYKGEMNYSDVRLGEKKFGFGRYPSIYASDGSFLDYLPYGKSKRKFSELGDMRVIDWVKTKIPSAEFDGVATER